MEPPTLLEVHRATTAQLRAWLAIYNPDVKYHRDNSTSLKVTLRGVLTRALLDQGKLYACDWMWRGSSFPRDSCYQTYSNLCYYLVNGEDRRPELAKRIDSYLLTNPQAAAACSAICVWLNLYERQGDGYFYGGLLGIDARCVQIASIAGKYRKYISYSLRIVAAYAIYQLVQYYGGTLQHAAVVANLKGTIDVTPTESVVCREGCKVALWFLQWEERVVLLRAVLCEGVDLLVESYATDTVTSMSTWL